MKRTIVTAVLMLCFTGALLADYQEELQKGEDAVNDGFYNIALSHYRKALLEKPDQKTSDTIIRLEEIIAKTAASGAAAAAKTAPSPLPTAVPAPAKPYDGGVSPSSVTVAFADLALVTATVLTYFWYDSSVNDYNVLLVSTDKTSYSAYLRLLTQYDEVKSREKVASITAGVTALAVVYTLADVFFLHYAFPVKIQPAVTAGSAGIMAWVRTEF